jgi:hypothetical protein
MDGVKVASTEEQVKEVEACSVPDLLRQPLALSTVTDYKRADGLV